MRQIVLDTETTGLSAEDGHRIIEIAGLEMINRRSTGRHVHWYLNPQRSIDEGARAVHGITEAQLADKPLFAEVAEDFVAFVADAELLIHNAAFDVGFLNAELARVGREALATVVGSVVDTLAMARELHPGRRNSLDALCERYGVSNAHRKLHGALLDAELLADVYLAMTRGQESLEMSLNADPIRDGMDESGVEWPPRSLRVLRADAEEIAAHEAGLALIAKQARGPAVWQLLVVAETRDAGPQH